MGWDENKENALNSLSMIALLTVNNLYSFLVFIGRSVIPRTSGERGGGVYTPEMMETHPMDGPMHAAFNLP
jgi:hypothetical protein